MMVRDFDPERDEAACRALASRAAMSSYGAALERQRSALSDQDAPLDPAEQRIVALAEASESPAGFIELRGNHIANLMVDPRFQGRGVGASLLAAAEARLDGDVTLNVFTVNPRARSFYERLGYVHIGERSIMFRGFEETVWRFIKRRPAMDVQSVCSPLRDLQSGLR